uniref:Methyltransferase domain-containing protein n=1 Tax=candidate division WOR-3 bacterium TaxID=2052148 RepID=A0A7V3NUI5_UNCW3
MPISKCRVCARKFFEEPLLRYQNMPMGAQHLPTLQTIGHDKGIELEIRQCSGCGLVQLSNDPVPYSKQVIRAAAFSQEMREFRIKQFQDFVKRFALKEKKIIEIGCGGGEYLSLMRESGADVYGIEYSKESVEQCVRSGLKVTRGFIGSSKCRLKHAPFDAFFMLNFLEHLPDPNSALRGIHNNLKRDGIGLVEVPNFDMILRKRLFSEFVSDHLLYFTKETLETTLRTNGFVVVEINEVWHNYIISAVVKKRERLDMSHFYDHQTKVIDQIEEYIGRFRSKRVAIWGAGHEAFAVASLAKLEDKVKYVVDSATFKQGRYTPATHIPIVPPDNLWLDPVDAVIVMAGSYSDEVARTLRERFGKDMNVAILRDFGLEVI